ncbi:hypothetical protein MTP09_09900 [Chryseobacterium suipulveris]|uniref:Uncharacterized protein n=1 Tax=Chryseobacterium suipulveris TaxID=2929800 RepID=A0ABY4BR35_9FLAO|nr:hypothetical protein [Chryseobacterium suipulveris]UOE40226.1 hypothetical protein MTP09_09900 [Chryseobacterium suipulveris]
MKYLVVAASLNGTGIRDKYNGGYVDIKKLGLSVDTINRIEQWLLNYEDEHYNGFSDGCNVDKLDKEGLEIAKIVNEELSDVKIEYFSDARMTTEILL